MKFVASVDFFTRQGRSGLRYEVIFVGWVRVIVCPTVHLWKWSIPVAVYVLNRRGPFQCIGLPRILNRLLAVENAVEEVEQEEQLSDGTHNRERRDDRLQVHDGIQEVKVAVLVVSAWCTGNAYKVQAHLTYGAVYAMLR